MAQNTKWHSLIEVQKVSDLVNWKFNKCPGCPPKIKTLDHQEACTILWRKGVLRNFKNLRHFMLRSLLLRRIFITKCMTTVPFDKSKFMIRSLCWSWSEKIQPWERDTKYYSLLELCYKWVSREPSLTPFLSLQIKCNNLWNLTLEQQHTQWWFEF